MQQLATVESQPLKDQGLFLIRKKQRLQFIMDNFSQHSWVHISDIIQVFQEIKSTYMLDFINIVRHPAWSIKCLRLSCFSTEQQKLRSRPSRDHSCICLPTPSQTSYMISAKRGLHIFSILNFNKSSKHNQITKSALFLTNRIFSKNKIKLPLLDITNILIIINLILTFDQNIQTKS